MKIKAFIYELREQIWKMESEYNRLSDAFCEGEELPEGFKSWDDVKYALLNLKSMIRNLDDTECDLYLHYQHLF